MPGKWNEVFNQILFFINCVHYVMKLHKLIFCKTSMDNILYVQYLNCAHKMKPTAFKEYVMYQSHDTLLAGYSQTGRWQG